jgi:hypothetical protein
MRGVVARRVHQLLLNIHIIRDLALQLVGEFAAAAGRLGNRLGGLSGRGQHANVVLVLPPELPDATDIGQQPLAGNGGRRRLQPFLVGAELVAEAEQTGVVTRAFIAVRSRQQHILFRADGQ